ncbi:caspase family protein [Streptomyces sp. NPDC020766]|uniref:wHTH domain-containing protein n=1 Tax=Streptomyces sp. NPDC020766 TaxID=3155011 RepID=UPI00340E3731
MTIRRSALLIGVGDTPRAASRFGSLADPVASDLAAMSAQLTASGYSLITVGQYGDGPAEKNDITTALERAAREECDLLFVYFTGHGVHIKGTDYLVPADALAPERGSEWSQAQRDSLLPVDMTSYLDGCRAESVVYAVDACRDSGPDEVSAGFGAATVHAPSKRLALLVGCGRGQRCHFDDAGSHFTRALAEALDPYAPQRTLEAVFRQARDRTTAYALRAGQDQRPSMTSAPRDEEFSDFPALCEGTEIPLRWRDEVEKASLWGAGPGEEGPDSPMRERVAEFARECAVSVLKDRRRFDDDPWNDPGLPTRTLRRVMPELLRGGAERSPVETGLLVALPFLREAMWARKLSRLADADPFDLDPVRLDARRTKMRTELQYVHESHPQLLRKARGHGSRGETDAHRALAAWLAHRWVAEQLVDPPDSGGEELIGRLARALLGPGQDHQEQVDEVRWLLAKSIRCLADDPVDLPSYNRYLGEAPTTLTTAEGRCPVRLWSVLGLVRLAGLLAADVRQFPDVLPDHVGVADPIRPADVVRTLHDQLEWAYEGDDLHLKMLCPHPALHEGLTDLALRADTVLRALHSAREQRHNDFPDRLPGRVTTRDLLPARRPQSEERVYSTPLLRFALAQDEIRELLMGHQLYGDRSLAVRELYQNAADACRYRELRWEYLKRRGGAPSNWAAEIRITQGREPSSDGRPGRAYIECRDNGVGMGRAQLEQTFSRAGRRFSQTRAFRQEQARWLEVDPGLRLHPYSRFGIGVLSYFMIADEVTLVTREVDAEGSIAPQALSVDISSSSGLFRIRGYEDGDDPMRDGGTRVRLMLSEPEGDEERVSALEVLRHQVRLNEHELVLRQDDGEPLVWPAGELRHPASEDDLAPVPPLDARGHVWWVTDNGMVLADGIVTSHKPFGYVVNLTGPQAPQLSVNRNSLLSWDEKWATEQVYRAAADLPGWPGLNLEWLWKLENSDIAMARVVGAELAGRGLTLPVYRTTSYRRPDVSLDHVGWFAEDRQFLPQTPESRLSGGGDLTRSWRLAVLRDQDIQVDESVTREAVLPKDVSGHPVPRPGDSDLIPRASGGAADLVDHACATGRTVADTLRGLRRYAILGSKMHISPVTADRTPALDFVPERVDVNLLVWMRDWAQPGRAERQPAVGALFSISAESGMTIGRLLERCLRYAPLGVEAPAVPSTRVLTHVATTRDAELLAGWTENGHTYCASGLPREVRPFHVARLAEQLGLTGAEVLTELRAWAFLGYRLPSEDELLTSAPSSDQWNLFRRFWDPWEETSSPTLPFLLVEATRRQMTVDAVLRSVGDLAGQAGMRLPDLRLPSAELPAMEESDRKLLTIDENERTPLPSRSISIDWLAMCHAPGGQMPGFGGDLDEEPWDVFVSRVERLAALGMSVPDDLEPLRHWVDLSPRDRIALLVGSLDPAVPWTAATVICLAGELRESVDDCLRRLAVHGPELGKEVPSLPDTAGPLSPGAADSALLTELSGMDTGGPLQAVWIDITAFHLAGYAHKAGLTIDRALDRLAPYRALGALVPELTDEQRELVTGLKPGPHDLLALSENMGGEEPRGPSPIGPLELLSLAARLGRTVLDVYERLSRYQPLGVTVDVPDAPAVLPLWQDLVLLSEGLNGREPALHGTVSADQIDALARELDTDRDWVVRRLHVYAAMFRLRVGAEAGEAEPEAARAAETVGTDSPHEPNDPQEQAS